MISLVRPDVALMDAALAGDAALAEAIGHEVAPGWVSFQDALRPTRDSIASQPEGFLWGTRFFVTDEPPELVGWGGFKGAPVDGVVELGYEIAEGRQGRGYATAVTRAMLAEAFADPEVSAVIAHTLPESNASTRVLEKTGFEHVGSVDDDGQEVWRFSLSRDAWS